MDKIFPTKEDCQNELDKSNFTGVDVVGVNIQFGIVPEFDEVVVIASDRRVFRCVYIPSRGIASRFREFTEKQNMEVR